MKTKKISKTLKLNKCTVTNIEKENMYKIKAGVVFTEEVYTMCYKSCLYECNAISDLGFTCDTVEVYCTI